MHHEHTLKNERMRPYEEGRLDFPICSRKLCTMNEPISYIEAVIKQETKNMKDMTMPGKRGFHSLKIWVKDPLLL